MINRLLRKLNINHHILPNNPRGKTLVKQFKAAEELTSSLIGIIKSPGLSADGSFKYKLEGVTLWVKPHLFIYDVRKK